MKIFIFSSGEDDYYNVDNIYITGLDVKKESYREFVERYLEEFYTFTQDSWGVKTFYDKITGEKTSFYTFEDKIRELFIQAWKLEKFPIIEYNDINGGSEY